MYQTQRAIGILGGTFDPIHHGHLRLGLELHDALQLSHVLFVPTGKPIYRKAPVATAAQRLSMVTCALSRESAFLVDDCEIKRQGPSYTIDTLIELRKKYPHTPLCFLMGIDAFLGLSSWHKWQEILKLAHLIIAHRPHYSLPQTGVIADLIKDHLETHNNFVHENLAGGILLQPLTPLEISATDIRKQIATGRNPRYLLPDSVYEYIQTEKIYSPSR